MQVTDGVDAFQLDTRNSQPSNAAIRAQPTPTVLVRLAENVTLYPKNLTSIDLWFQVPTSINASDIYDTNKDGILDADEVVSTCTQLGDQCWF